MTASDLLDSFETLADAPGGIDHLRELVLHLAVRGRLVPQDPAEEPAYALLEHITEERQRLAEDGSLRKQKPQAPVQSQETPFDIPKGWAWARLGHYCALEMGQSPPSEFYNQDGGGLPFFQGKADFGDLNPTPRYWCTRPTKYANSGDVLLSVRAPVGPTNVATEECCIGRGIAGLRPLGGTPTMMLLWTMRAFESDLCALGTGTTFVAISKKNLEPFVLPVPPLDEQHRIVARVDELMALLDRLEEAKEARDATRAQLRDAALAALQSANDAEEVKTAWSRIADHMHVLFTDPADIPPFRQTILGLAVRGRITAQDSSDEPATAILERCDEEKYRLIEGKQIRKPRPLPVSPGDDCEPFDLPEGWLWTHADRLLAFVTSGSRGWAKYYANAGAPFLRIGNLDYGTIKLDLSAIQRVVPPEGAEGRRTSTQGGDILVSITGDTGMVGLVPDDLEESYINQHVALCRPLAAVLPEFIALQLISPLVLRQLWGAQRGIKNSLGLDDIRRLRLPLPPIAEQRRIITRLAELTTLLDRLEVHLGNCVQAQELFCASAVRALPVEHPSVPQDSAVAVG